MAAPSKVQTGGDLKDVKLPPQGPAVLSDSFMKQLQFTSDLRNTWATILLYAPARWGKTRMIATADSPLIIATEMGKTRGMQTLSHLNIPVLFNDSAQQFIDTCKELKKVDCQIPNYGRVNTVIVDSGSHLGQQWMEAAVKALGWTTALPEKGKDTRQAYQYLAEKGHQSMKALFDVPAHICFICREGVQEEKQDDGRGGTITIQWAAPELPGQKLPRELPGWPDATLHGVFKNGQRLIQTRTHNRAVAGIRVRGDIEVPEFIVPNMKAICEVVISKDKDVLMTALNELKVGKAA